MGVRDEAINEAINLGSSTETHVIDMANMINDLTENVEGISYTKRRNF